MGRRRRCLKAEWDEGSDVDMKTERLHQAMPKRSIQQRMKNKERKRKLKKGKSDFGDKIRELEHAEPIPEPVLEFPISQPSFTPSSDVATLVSGFLTRKMNLLEHTEGNMYLTDFYAMNCLLSVHAAPFIAEKYDTIMEKNSTNRKDCKTVAAVNSMFPYLFTSSNLLKGNWPLPSWALDFDSTESKQKVDKSQRKKLQVISKMQDFNSKYFKRQQKRAILPNIRQFETTHTTVHAAEGLQQVRSLLESIPLLLTIQSDITTCYDIIDHGYRTLCLEMPREQSKNKTSILLHAPLVRWVQRTVILIPPPVLKIVNEIICVAPVSDEQQAKYADIIRDAIENWVSNIEKTGLSTTILPPSEVSMKAMKINHLSSMTGMNQAYSEQCLSECDWDLQIALEAFKRLREAGTLSEDAFV
nr:nuclear RNA export factor 1:2 [Hymenolepis microstoma]